MGRFLSADPFVQDPSNLQSLNPYSYVQNNPLSYVDPSGHFLSGLFKAIGKFFSRVFHGIVHAVKAVLSSSIVRAIIQIAICATPGVGVIGCAAAAAGLTLGGGGSVLDAVKAFAFTLISLNTWSGVGNFLRDVGVAGNLFVKSLVHGVVGGALSMAQGGGFWQGFASNAIGAGTGLVSNSISGGDVFLDSAIVGAAGGAVSVLTGGKFAAGFITAAFANLYNKMADRMNPYFLRDDILEGGGGMRGGGGSSGGPGTDLSTFFRALTTSIAGLLSGDSPTPAPQASDEEARTTIYRAIDPDELAYLQKNGDYGYSPNASGKYFALTEAGVENFVAMPYNANRDLTVTSTTVPTTTINEGYVFTDTGAAGPSVHFDDVALANVYRVMTPVRIYPR